MAENLYTTDVMSWLSACEGGTEGKRGSEVGEGLAYFRKTILFMLEESGSWLPAVQSFSKSQAANPLSSQILTGCLLQL